MGERKVMLAIFFHVLFTPSGYTQNVCLRGWFGQECQYKCRCVGNQCDGDGNCRPGYKCESGWFGPACQYYNLVRLGSSSYRSNSVTDEDDATCNSYQYLAPMSTKWSTLYHFSWLRLRVSKLGVYHQINLTIKDKGGETTCADLTRVIIDDQTLDIHCPLSVFMTEIELTGDGVNYLCSLYISGGRNVAIKQKSTQSSIYTDSNYDSRYSQSDNAVDGNPSGRFEASSCAHTNREQNPSWDLFLAVSKQVNRYMVYNRDIYSARLNGFILESYDASGKLVLQYQDNNTSPSAAYTMIDTQTDQLIRRVHIYLNRSGNLVLCEVELYGDSFCRHGHYGRDCELTCNCDLKSDSCFVSTGGCPSGCPVGFSGEGCRKACDIGRYGKDCTEMCSYQCVKVACNAVDGTCADGCSQGYKPPFCNEECDSGFHGFNCTQACSKNCNGTCGKQNGVCLHGCMPGYKGDMCVQECDLTTFGAGCQQQCNSTCVKSDCHHVTGFCKECQPGKRGDQCEDVCSPGTYGKMCANICSENCQGNEGCHNENGDCMSGCKIGYEGTMCDKPCENLTYGESCKSNCSQFCAVDNSQSSPVCHHISGECRLGCTSEYEGLKCLKLKLTDSGVQTGAIAGPIVAGLLLVVILVIAMFVWRRRKQIKGSHGMTNGNRRESEFSVSPRSNSITNRPSLVIEKPPSYSNISELAANGKINEIYYNTAPEPHDTAIAVEDLNTFMLSHTKEYFTEQFKSVPISSNASMAVGLSAENKNKNRYKNISAYDHNRVQLVADGSKGQGDYINASYVQGYKKKETFIASQGPSKVILQDFVRLLWEQKSDIVVMLTNLVEQGKQKCEQYWPEGNDLELGEIKVKLLSSQVLSDCVIRKLQLVKESRSTHTVTQYHFTSWPDKSVPTTPWALVDFQQRVFSYPTNTSIVVHCSAGVGRTGTFIALRNVIKEAEDTGYMDFYTTLSQLRQDRINMIQTVEQFIFLHEAAQVALACVGTTIASGDLNQKINELEEKTASGHSKLEKEFKAVCDLCTGSGTGSDDEGSGGSASSTYANSRTLVNKAKNRFSNVLPKDLYRPHLFCETKDMGEYINAVLLPSLTSQNSQILTQLPLPTTVTDLWRLVTQYNVSLIAVFDVDFDDSTIGSYIPSGSGVPLQCGPFEIKVTSEQSSAVWEEKTLLAVKQKKRKPSLTTSSLRTQEHKVTHLKCTSCDFDPENLLTFIQKIRSSRHNDKSRVLYMCRNGALCSGLVCVLTFLLDRIDADNQVTVPLAVGTVKAIRPQAIPTLDQYRILYQVLNFYCDTNNTYSNCAEVTTKGKLEVKTGVTNKAFEDNENHSENIYANF